MKNNPDKLTAKQVETRRGFRLLDRDEITTSHATGAIEFWSGKEWKKSAHSTGDSETITYRTMMSREELAAARKLARDNAFTAALKQLQCQYGVEVVVRIPRTDAEIIDQTNELARKICRIHGYDTPVGLKFYNSVHSRSHDAWLCACEAQKLLTDTDPEDALANLE